MLEYINNKYSPYYLASIAANEGRKDEAFSLLKESIDHGLRPEASLTMALDPDLKSSHAHSRFALLIASAKDRAAGGTKTK